MDLDRAEERSRSSAQAALDRCRQEAMNRREIWHVIYDSALERFEARPRTWDIAETTVVGDSGSDGVFHVRPSWLEHALMEGWE